MKADFIIIIVVIIIIIIIVIIVIYYHYLSNQIFSVCQIDIYIYYKCFEY